MNGLPFVAGRFEVEQQIGASVLQMLEEEHAAGVVGMRFRPRVPFLNDGHLCGVIVSDHAVASLLWRRAELRVWDRFQRASSPNRPWSQGSCGLLSLSPAFHSRKWRFALVARDVVIGGSRPGDCRAA
jgi:hypothetical protein